MAVGADATAGGFPLVPESGEGGKAKQGWFEINRTRDFVAQVKKLIPGGKTAYRKASGFTWGTTTPGPSYGDNGDFYVKFVEDSGPNGRADLYWKAPTGRWINIDLD